MSAKELLASHQTRLAELGYYKLRIDGEWGPGTENAFTRFKRAHGFTPRPYPGPLTCAALWDKEAKEYQTPTVPGEPKWVTEAKVLLGTREAPGSANNPVIMKWAVDLDQWYPGDDVAWCGLFTAHCMAVGAPDEPQNFNRLGAREWLNYGQDALNGADPKRADLPFGGVPVFWRTAWDHWHGHVAPCITAQNDTHVEVIGGNQSDAVISAWFPRSRLLGVRKPPGAQLVSATDRATGSVSTNEA